MTTPEANNSEHKINVLIVDDQQPLLMLVSAYLDRFGGYHYQTFDDPEKAWEYFVLKPDEFQMGLFDYRMPKMDGLELARKIKAVQPSMRILLATSDPIDFVRSQDHSNAVDGYIEKPFPKLMELRNVLNHTMGLQKE